MLRFVKKRKRATASIGILTAATVALGVMAFTHPGFTTTDVDMHDGGVWVTNTDESLIGHLNYQAGELDSGLMTSSTKFDLVQYGGTVIVIDDTNASLNPIDTGQAAFRGDVPLPGSVDVSLRGGTLTVLQQSTGELWATDSDSVASLDFAEHDPIAVLGAGASVTADEAGSVHAVSAEHGTQYRWEPSPSGYELAEEQARPELAGAVDLTVTTVGEVPVALDAATGTLLLPGVVTEAPQDAVLQHPGTQSSEVILATGSALIRQPIGGGEATSEQFAIGGSAVAPVQIDTCIHAAWPGDARVVRICDDDSANIDTQVTVPLGSEVVFREHRGVVALNDTQSGVSWLMSDELIMVDNWADLIPPTSEEESEELDHDSMDDTIDNIAPDPSEENNPPVANDDTIFGARTGRSTLVPVLHNDSDQDGDILTVSLLGDAPDDIRISPVQNSSQFQVEIPEDYGANQVQFRYEVNDGRGGTDDAVVTLAIRDNEQNSPPEELRSQGFEVEQRAEYEHSVFENWFDPDGDDLFLVDAYSDSGDTVRFNPSGRIVYTATGEPGQTTMTVVVSDGVDETEGTIDVAVRERGTSSPVANADYVDISEGQSTSVNPLANDFLPAGESARLASATPRGDVTVDLDRSTNTLHVTAGSVGTHFIDYTVAAGPSQAQGHVRVDVTEPAQDARPVAVRDVALVPMGGEALVDLTENDVDPTGGVLVVQSLASDGAPVSVQLLQRHMLRVEDNNGLSERTTLTYDISNGTEVATGEIVIIPVAPPEQPRNPVAVDDSAVVREGDFTTVNVLENDFSPDNVPFTLNPELVQTSLLPEDGHVFVADDSIRIFVAEGGPSSVGVTYEISDEQGNADTASLRVDVEPRDRETNRAPHARDVTARVLAGNVVRIPIPLNGIDPDGDGVTLVGWETAPDIGRIIEVGPDYIDFEAFRNDSGTTTFEYRVRDRWGAEATSSVTVGIAQPSAVNQPPNAALDTVHVRPDRAVAVAVLDNDSDPDGDELQLTDVNTDEAPPEFTDLRLGDEAPTVNFTAPADTGDYTLEYTIRDARGATAIGAILVRVDESAPLLPPVAVDDTVDVADLTPGEPYVVPVLENDRDPDGDPTELEVQVLTGEGTVVADGVQVVPSEEFQVVTYSVTDQDGGSGSAFIFVPGVGVQLPYIATHTQLFVDSGVPLEIDLATVVEMPNGGTPRITTADTVSATNANGDELVVDEQHLVYTSEESYVGEAAISFEVTDGTGPDDPDGNTARLTVPIQVFPSSAVSPDFQGAEITVEPAERASEFDLREATWDPDEGDIDAMVYRLQGGEADGITVEITGQNTFRASASPDTPPGTRGAYQIELEDPAGNVESGTVTVQVVASTRPHPRAEPDSGTVDQGEEFSTNVIANDFNPFANIGEPLTVRDVSVASGQVQSEPTTDGTNVSVIPEIDFSGTLTLQYTIEDATGSDDRTAVGIVEINVRGRPDSPLRPNVNAIGDSEVSLSWAAPAANGAQITGYIVQWDGGSQECDATSCTVTGLTNDTVYNFAVVAVNNVGESEPSPQSIDARPDVRPEQPNPPTAQRGDQELLVSWEAPENRGSAIEHYILEISPPAPDGTTQREVNSTNLTWDGLNNGTEYTFRVQAVNQADEPSEFSRESRGQIPAGPPSAPGEVIASANQLGGATNQVTVTWTSADPNGREVTEYTITPYLGGQAQSDLERTVGGSSVTFTYESLNVNEREYTFDVFATNEVDSGESAESSAVRLVNQPDPPTLSHVADSDGSSTINIEPGDLRGYRSDEVEYEYSVGGANSWQPTGTGRQEIGAPNGSEVVAVRAIAQTDGASNTSDAARQQIHPYGPIGNPAVSASPENNGVGVSWSAPSANGHPVSMEIRTRVGGGGWGSWQSVGNSGSRTIAADPGEEVVIEARASTGMPNDNGNGAQTTTARDSGEPNGPAITVSRGSEATGVTCTEEGGAQCRYIRLTWENLPTGTYTRTCHHSTQGPGSDGFTQMSMTINSQNGNSSSYETNDGTAGWCYTGYEGEVWITLTGGGETYVSPRISWPQ